MVRTCHKNTKACKAEKEHAEDIYKGGNQLKNAEWTPAMVERAARKIRKIEKKTSLSAVLLSSVTGIVASIAFYSLIKILVFRISMAGEPEEAMLVNLSTFYLQLNSMVQTIGKIGAVFLLSLEKEEMHGNKKN